jgi:hypothetical protein
MSERHKHADVIIAWANGEEIQYRAVPGEGGWETFPRKTIITWCEYAEYRVKPILVTKVGWVNVYPDKYEDYSLTFHFTKDHADRKATEARVACIRVEWEEEE